MFLTQYKIEFNQFHKAVNLFFSHHRILQNCNYPILYKQINNNNGDYDDYDFYWPQRLDNFSSNEQTIEEGEKNKIIVWFQEKARTHKRHLLFSFSILFKAGFCISYHPSILL